MTEIGVLYSLDKLDLLFEVLLIFNWNVTTHLLFIYIMEL
jgi:hypothetical protein